MQLPHNLVSTILKPESLSYRMDFLDADSSHIVISKKER